MSDPARTIAGMEISSSWIIIDGDVVTADGRRANGKKKGPRTKRGPKLTAESRINQQRKIIAARERRHAGLVVGRHGRRNP